jgi:hypothetical protein
MNTPKTTSKATGGIHAIIAVTKRAKRNAVPHKGFFELAQGTKKLQLIPWSRDVSEKLKVAQLIKNLAKLYVRHRFIAVFIGGLQWTLF